MASFFSLLEHQPVLFLFLLIGAGMALGHVKIKGVGLGAAAVLFLAIALAAGAEVYGIHLKIAPQLGTLGLALFAFSIGVNAGGSFFHNLKTAIGPIFAMVALYILTAGAGVMVGRAMGMETALIAGTFAGALTNTPALAAAGNSSGNVELATVGYSISYLFGVIGMMIAAAAALSYGKRDTDVPSPLVNRTIRVDQEATPTISQMRRIYDSGVVFSRLRRGEDGPVVTPVDEDVLHRGDLIAVVGSVEVLEQLTHELGHTSSHALAEDRSYLDFRRIMVSNPSIAGHKVEDLNIIERFSATISRVRRGDIDIIATPDLVIQKGDSVRVVAPFGRMKEITKFFGDSTRGLSDLNPIALGLGMALGILIGELRIFTPSGDYFSIGSAAGTLLVGLVFGRLGCIGTFVTAIPVTAAQVLAEIGLLIFLAQAGANAGGQISTAFASGTWIKILLLGMMITSIMAIGLYCAMRWGFKMGGTRLSGLLAGSQTQPAVLAFANAQTNMDARVALGYALVYPVAMIGKILVAQVIGGL